MKALDTLTLTGSLGLFCAGILAPMMIIHPGFGDHTDLVGYLFPELVAPRSVNLLGGVLDLVEQGAWLLAGLLGLFSLGLPCAKFFVCAQALDGRQKPAHLKFIHTFGFLSMAEVVFVSVLAVTLKHLPGGTHVERGWGLWCYLISVVLLSVVTVRLYGEHARGVSDTTPPEQELPAP